nr:unnamed protein product [Digitaria exilis]CAB3478492.1 unnamed protein product [Digitaria exilis]
MSDRGYGYSSYPPPQGKCPTLRVRCPSETRSSRYYNNGPPVMAPPQYQYGAPPPRREPSFLEGCKPAAKQEELEKDPVRPRPTGHGLSLARRPCSETKWQVHEDRGHKSCKAEALKNNDAISIGYLFLRAVLTRWAITIDHQTGALRGGPAATDPLLRSVPLALVCHALQSDANILSHARPCCHRSARESVMRAGAGLPLCLPSRE